MVNTETVKQAALELDAASEGGLSTSTTACIGENFYLFLGDVFKKSAAKGNNFGKRICSKTDLLNAIEKERAHKAP